MSADETTINPDGSATFDETPPGNDNAGEGGREEFDEQPGFDSEEVIKNIQPGVDPAVYFLVAVIVMAALYYYFVYRKRSSEEQDTFFSNLDGDKVSS